MKLSLLSILLGVGMSVPQVYALTKPAQFTVVARRLPRNVPVGVALMLLGTAWFLWIVNAEPIADFSAYKPMMMIAFGAIGVLTCIFIQDFLAARGIAVLLLLLGKLMLDTGRPHLGQSSFVLLIQIWAYLLIIAGVWFTIAPWRFRDFIEFATANANRIRVGSLVRLAFAIFIAVLGLTAFRQM